MPVVSFLGALWLIPKTVFPSMRPRDWKQVAKKQKELRALWVSWGCLFPAWSGYVAQGGPKLVILLLRLPSMRMTNVFCLVENSI